MNADKIKAARKRYYEKNKEKIKAKSNQYYATHKDKIKARQKEYEQTHPELIKEQRSRNSKKHREQYNESAREYNRKNRDKQRDRSMRDYYNGLARRMVSNAKQRARKKNLPFDITVDDIHIPSHCPILNIELIWGEGLQDATPSLDRIIPSLGYIKNNVAVISNIANKLKRNATLEQLEMICEYLKEHTHT